MDRFVPEPLKDPYPEEHKARCLFAGTLFDKHFAPKGNAVLVDKLNKPGKFISSRGARLYVLGPGDEKQLDRRHVSYLGVVPYEKTWDYFYFAHVDVEQGREIPSPQREQQALSLPAHWITCSEWGGIAKLQPNIRSQN